MAVKFGLNQINNPAPLLYRRLLNVFIIFIIPATATFVITLPVEAMNETTKILIGAFSTYVLAILKGVEYLLGDSSETEVK